ncbi:hypothetical protein SS1G_08628 [Sclerotinia sclerotiorum 1980 UF-70]|uniref:Major facilitator superfamily (MFS) profile domain-containing protein n=1 Tax=Sclerotinia sclerotiorum (strain ATCC 18683 / 1980 / Ss-1) TaxID=665079 RepID=A7ETH2_SCLS1|nr:hypothetical protein SS1G_08628 [Sclerotinia sclerotiorum 1980 UF-70]EDN92764.1 hypothetical protein SS1G_08628 [Sclerotinia sclerotiorum 1980 UF-70]
MIDSITRQETRKSGASRPDSSPGLNRCLSGNHLDDTSYYTGHPNTQGTIDQETEHASTVDSEDTDTDGVSTISPEVIDGIEVERDVELGREKTRKSLKSVRDLNLVSWEGPDDPENPKNWKIGRKWAAVLVVSSFTFISPVSSSMVAPALASISADLHIVNSIEQSLVLSIFVLAYAVGLFFLQETFAPVLLGRKKNKLIQETGNQDLHTEWDVPNRTITTTLKISLTRPFKLLGTQVIIQVLAVYMAYLYGIMYLVLSTFPGLWEGVYGESTAIGGLNYISLGTGFFLGTQICAPAQDRIYRALKARNNGVGKPEFRVPLMIPGAFLVPVGLFWYGWSAQAQTHWIVPNIGAAIFAAGTIIGFQCIQTYIVDSYTKYAASAVGAATVMRSLAGFGFPLFAPYMYAALDYGWGNSLLGFIAIGLGWPAPILLWLYGEKLRMRSTFAAG